MIVLFVCKDTNKNSINKNYLDKSVIIIHFYQDKSVDMVHFYQDNVIAFVHHLAACRAASDGCVPCPQGDALGLGLSSHSCSDTRRQRHRRIAARGRLRRPQQRLMI